MRSERGEINLVGLLVATLIFGFVMSATLLSFDTFNRNTRDSQVRNEATDKARQATDQLARQMRNLATPTALQPNAIALASAYDLVFETVAPKGTPPAGNPQNIEFVRYCLDAATRRLWTMEMLPSTITATTVAPSAPAACPGAGTWTNARVVADWVVNRDNSQTRPVFSYDSSTNNAIRRVRVDLYVDTDPGKGPAEQRVATGAGLRNQDQAPVAQFTYATPGSGVILLDGTSSTDPDNDPLSYCWYDSAATSTVGTCQTKSIGDSATLRYKPSNTTVDHSITLTVTDPSGLPHTSAPVIFGPHGRPY